MPGFYISCTKEKHTASYEPLPKFENDKTYSEYENGDIAILDGVLLNKKALFEKYMSDSKEQNVRDLVFLLRQRREDFFEEFRGAFSGAYYSAAEKVWIVFTNHTADGAVYYHAAKDGLLAASDPKWIIDRLSEKNVEMTVDETAVYYMLTYGFMTDERTYCREITRLLPGQYLKYSVATGQCELLQYYEVKRDKLDLAGFTEEKAIEELDRLYIECIKMEFDKDLEYGYRHYCELSGGLDSRMVYWVAHELGYTGCLTFTFGQSDCLDEKVAKQIADYWNEEMAFMPSDSAKFMSDVIGLTRLNHGASIYYGGQMTSRAFEVFDMEKFGIIHTGQLGDSVIGTYVSKPDQIRKTCPSGTKAYSTMLVGEYEDKSHGRFGNYDEQLLVTRGMLGCCGPHLIARRYSEVYSATLNPDMIDYCLSIPIEWRVNRRIYRKWILAKHPEAAKFTWATKNQKITDSDFYYSARRFFDKLDWVRRNPRVILEKLGFKVKPAPQKHGKRESMAPVDRWYNETEGVSEKLDTLYKDLMKKHSPSLSEKLVSDMTMLYERGHATEKGLVLSALGALEYYFG